MFFVTWYKYFSFNKVICSQIFFIDKNNIFLGYLMLQGLIHYIKDIFFQYFYILSNKHLKGKDNFTFYYIFPVKDYRIFEDL